MKREGKLLETKYQQASPPSEVEERPADGWSLALTDELGAGRRTVFYEVVPVPERERRQRLRGVDDFRDLRQLCLLDRIAGGGR